MKGLIFLLVVVGIFAAWWFLRGKKKEPKTVQYEEITGYRIRFFKKGKEVDSKIIR